MKKVELLKWVIVSAAIFMISVMCNGMTVKAETGTPINGRIKIHDLKQGDYIGENTIMYPTTSHDENSEFFIKVKPGSDIKTTSIVVFPATIVGDLDFVKLKSNYDTDVIDSFWNPAKGVDGSLYLTNVNAFRVEYAETDHFYLRAVHLIIPESTENESVQSTQSTSCDHTYEWVVQNESTEDADGLMVYKCSKCGAISNSRKIPKLLDNYSYVIEKNIKIVNQAKAGQTIKIDLKTWNSMPKAFFVELTKRQVNTTIVIRFIYKNKVYEFTIAPDTVIDTTCDYYGPEKLIELYGAEVINEM